MRLFSAAADKFNGATAETKAAIIAAICGWLGVFGGFVLYVVFTHLFEHGGVTAKIVGVTGGLAASVVIAWFAHRLWETIDEGRVSLGWQSRRTVIAVVSLVIVFELSASAFEDFVRALSGDFEGIRRVAADIAGRDTKTADDAIGEEDVAVLLGHLRAEAAQMPRACPDCVKRPGARLLTLLPRTAALEMFAGELKPSDEDVYATYLDPLTQPLIMGRQFTSACNARRPGSLSALMVLEPVQQSAAERQAQIAACREQLASTGDDQRRRILARALTSLLGRHDLYDAESFKLDATGEPLKLGAALHGKLSAQRAACDAIRANASSLSRLTCLEVARSALAKAGAGYLLPVSDVRAMNRELLASAFPGMVAPLPVYWWDLALLFLIWSTAAVVVGVYLTTAVFAEPKADAASVHHVGGLALIAVLAIVFASVLAGAMLVVSRLLPFLWQLMFDPAAADTASFHPIFALIPWLVQSLASGSLIGVEIPGWVSLPALVVGALAVWRAGLDKSDSNASMFAGLALLGLLLTSLAPVMGGLLGVVLIVAGAWFVPAFGLALMLPYLKPASSLPQWWGIVALLGGAALALWVATIFGGDDLYRGALATAGLTAAVTGVLILRRVPVGELWPLLAITTALALVGGAAAFQQLTFGGALQALHPVSQGRTVEAPTQLDVFRYLYTLRPQAEAEDIPEAFRASPSNDDVRDVLRLELALTGSIGFWLTIGMLVAWSLKQGPRKHEREAPS